MRIAISPAGKGSDLANDLEEQTSLMKTDLLTRQHLRPPIEISAGPAGVAVGLGRRIGTRILHELREALFPTIFFFISFNFIVLTTNLLVAKYAVAVSNFMLATLAALVVGKAVITANSMPFLRLFDRAPLVQPILSRNGRALGTFSCGPK